MTHYTELSIRIPHDNQQDDEPESLTLAEKLGTKRRIYGDGYDLYPAIIEPVTIDEHTFDRFLSATIPGNIKNPNLSAIPQAERLLFSAFTNILFMHYDEDELSYTYDVILATKHPVDIRHVQANFRPFLDSLTTGQTKPADIVMNREYEVLS